MLTTDDLHASVSDPLLDTMNFLNEITTRYPEAISFAPGRPYDGFFDVEQVFAHLRRYLDHLAETGASPGQVRDALFQYGPTAGRIRELVADSLRKDEGIDVPPEAVVVTVGCQEAMLLAVRALHARPEDVLLVASPCYVGIAGAARVLDVETAPVHDRDGGFDCAALREAVLAERARGRRPRACYLIPDHANPRGTTVPLATRHRLLDLADELDLLLLEDSPYRMVSPGAQLPTLKALDLRRAGHRGPRVVHLGSYAKTLFPGARVGYVVADQPVTDRAGRTGLLAAELTKIKSMVTVNTSPLGQAVVAGMLLAADGHTGRLNAESSAYYGDTMRATLRRLAECFPPARREALGVRWTHPEGGFFLALDVPFAADSAALARSARQYGVIWTPLSYFHPHGGGTHGIRLSTSYLTEHDIAEGIARLARFVEAEASGGGRPLR